MQTRIEEAFHEADLAFWEKVAKAFPEATSGDFAPDESFEWSEAAKLAIRRWTDNNVPQRTATDVDVIMAFWEAISYATSCNPADEERSEKAHIHAFDTAADAGYDWESDNDFMEWGLKATQLEILVEGLYRALEAIRNG
jgi:hypothetical protein